MVSVDVLLSSFISILMWSGYWNGCSGYTAMPSAMLLMEAILVCRVIRLPSNGYEYAAYGELMSDANALEYSAMSLIFF